MPTSLFTGTDLDLLYPPFLERLLDFRAKLRADGLEYRSVRGFVSPLDARDAYAAGTLSAPPYLSPHCYGLAEESAPVVDGALRPVRLAFAAPPGLVLAPGSERFNLRASWPGLLQAELAMLRLDWLAEDGGSGSDRERYLRKLRRVWGVVDLLTAEYERALRARPTQGTDGKSAGPAGPALA